MGSASLPAPLARWDLCQRQPEGFSQSQKRKLSLNSTHHPPHCRLPSLDMHLARTCKKTQAAGRWGLSLDLGAPSGRGGSPGPAGSPQSRLSKLQVAAGAGKGRAGARRGGVRDKPSPEALDLGGKGGKRGIGGVSGLVFFWFAVVGIGAGNSAPKLSPKEGRGISAGGGGRGSPARRGGVN